MEGGMRPGKITEIPEEFNTTNIIITRVVLPLSTGDTFQDPQWMSETADSTKPFFSPLNI